MAGSGKSLLRKIVARIGYEFDDTNLKKHIQGTEAAIKATTALGLALLKTTKTGYDTAIKAQRLEAEKATKAKKQQAIETEKEKTATQKAARAAKEFRLEQLKINQALKNSPARKAEQELKRLARSQQHATTTGRAMSRQFTRDAVQIIGVLASMRIPQVAISIERAVQKIGFRIRNLIGDAQYKRMQRRLEEIKQATGQRYSTQGLEEAADLYLTMDRNVGRATKTIEYAAKASPILGREMGEITKAFADFAATGGNVDQLAEIGIFSPEYAVKLKRITNLTKREYKEQRLAILQAHMYFTEEQKRLAHEAATALPAAIERLKSFGSDLGKEIGGRWGRWLTIGINGLRRIKNMIDRSGDKKFIYDLISLGSGAALAAAGIGVLVKISNLLGISWLFKSGFKLIPKAFGLFRAGGGILLRFGGSVGSRLLPILGRLAVLFGGVLVKALISFAAFLLSPIGIILLVAAALTGLWLLIKDTKLGQAIKEMIGDVIDKLKALLTDLQKTWEEFDFKTFINDLFNIDFTGIFAGFSKSFDNVLKMISDMWQNSTVKTIFDNIGKTWDKVTGFFNPGGVSGTNPGDLIRQTSGTSSKIIKTTNTTSHTYQVKVGGQDIKVEGTGDKRTDARKVKEIVKEEIGNQVEEALLQFVGF